MINTTETEKIAPGGPYPPNGEWGSTGEPDKVEGTYDKLLVIQLKIEREKLKNAVQKSKFLGP